MSRTAPRSPGAPRRGESRALVNAGDSVDEVEIAALVEAFLRERSHVSADDASFSRGSNLWEDGYVDSIGVVELIGFLEATFGVELPDEALFHPDFTSIDGIARIVSALPALPPLPTVTGD